MNAARRVPSLLAGMLVALIAGCTEQEAPTLAGIDGSNDLVTVGELLFVTATDNNELRVIDLAAEDFVRAPNPIHPLSIPVVDRPVALARDVVWSGDVAEGGSYVYALSANGRQLSVVRATSAPDSLQEVAIWSTDSGEMLTAVAAQGDPGPGNDAPPGASTLFVATYDGFDARIRTLSISQTPEKALSGGTVMTQLSCASITSLLVLPNGALAWAARPTACRDGSTPTPPRAEIIDGSGIATPLAFPAGIAVRKLFTHDAYTDSAPNPNPHPAAERIFGVLDERSCGGGPSCRGIFAVAGPGKTPPFQPVATGCDARVGDAACDFSGVRMLPIVGGTSLIMDAALIPRARPTIVPDELGDPETSLIGVFTTSDGRTVFFDAQRLRHFDVNTGPPTAVSFAVRARDRSLLPHEEGPVLSSVALANGAARSELIQFTFLGDLPGLSGLVLPAESQEIPALGVDLAALVEVGDLAYEQKIGENSPDCSQTGVVTGVS